MYQYILNFYTISQSTNPEQFITEKRNKQEHFLSILILGVLTF